jgi:Zn-finger nucleic acid-binding protein
MFRGRIPGGHRRALAYADGVICPKCQSRMMTFNRNGVHIEQCENCRGIFLDRGELEHIVNAEQHHYGGAPAYGAHTDSPGPYQGYRDSPKPYRSGHYKDSPAPFGGHHRDSPPPYGRRRKRSFLEDLFD